MKGLSGILFSVWCLMVTAWAEGFKLQSPDIHGRLDPVRLYEAAASAVPVGHRLQKRALAKALLMACNGR